MTSASPVLIIGAGLAGLVLARSLLKKNIPTIVFEQAAKGKSPGYGLTLQPSAYRPLLDLLKVDEASFRKAVAVDAAIGQHGHVENTNKEDLLRANKRKLRDFLAESVEIRWDHRLKSISTTESQSVTAEFENGESVQGSLLIAGDGVHSIAREQVLPHVKPDVLRYSVINGQRRVSRSLFDEVFASAFANTASITKTVGETGLVISINDTEAERISISYTYSRPASKAEGGDKLFTPDRPKEDAKVIPEAFFEELAELADLEEPFKEIFDAKKARDDKLLSWLMRSVRLSDDDLAKLPKRVGLLGDAAHAVPIVAGEGGNHAILDGLQLGAELEKDLDNGYGRFVQSAASRWREGIARSEENLERLHVEKSKL